MSIQRLSRTLLPVLAAVSMAACDDATGPEGTGNVSAAVTDGGAPALYMARQTTGPDAGPQAVTAFSGTMSGSAQVQIYSSAHGWVDVGSPRSMTCSMQSGSETSVASNASVQAGTYTKVRLILDGFRADLNSGSIIGSVTLSAGVSISVGGGSRVEIEKEVTPFTVSAESDTKVVFDLNSETWVTEDAAESRTAAAAAVRSATTATVVAG